MAATSTSDVQSSVEGPVLTLINKRIRALRKKQNRIIQMEESLSQGKTLNKEQQEVLRSKPGVFALIDELEKLRSPLSAAVSEEVSLAIQSHQAQASSSAGTVNGDADVAEEVEEAVPDVSAGEEDEGVLGDLLNLLYFGSLFDVMPQSDFTSMMLTRTHERGCCLTYDYVTDDATDLLGEKDLDLIASLKGLMISRPVSSSLSHKNALQRCIEHAKLWLAKSDQPIDPQSSVTYVGLREKLSKILSSDYYTTTPEMRGPVEMAAAAGVASFGSFQVPVHGSVVPMPVQPQGSVEQHQEAKETDNHQDYETSAEQQPAPAEEELQKGDDPDAENTTEEVSIQAADHDNTHSEEQQQQQQQQRDIDSREQHQYAPRRPYQNQRGGGRGGRRGYPNGRGGRGGGRGGGPYQNGRGQYYDQGGSYYPRTNYRGRGGRGGGGNSYYSHSTGIPSQDEQ